MHGGANLQVEEMMKNIKKNVKDWNDKKTAPDVQIIDPTPVKVALPKKVIKKGKTTVTIPAKTAEESPVTVKVFYGMETDSGNFTTDIESVAVEYEQKHTKTTTTQKEEVIREKTIYKSLFMIITGILMAIIVMILLVWRFKK